MIRGVHHALDFILVQRAQRIPHRGERVYNFLNFHKAIFPVSEFYLCVPEIRLKPFHDVFCLYAFRRNEPRILLLVDRRAESEEPRQSGAVSLNYESNGLSSGIFLPDCECVSEVGRLLSIGALMHGYREGLLEAGHYVVWVPSTAYSRDVNQNLGGRSLASAVAAGSDVVGGVVLGVRVDGADVCLPSVEERCLHLLRAHV